MKKYIFLILGIFISNLTQGQHTAINGIDEFTKEYIIQVNASKHNTWKQSDNISNNTFKYMFLSLKSYSKDFKTKVLQLNLQFPTTICVSKYNGKIILLLEDTSTITLVEKDNIECGTNVTPIYLLKDTDIETLCHKKINKIRLYTEDGYIDLEIKDKKKEIITHSFLLFKKLNTNE